MNPIAAAALKRAQADRQSLPTSVLDEPDSPVQMAKPVRATVKPTLVEPATMSSPVEKAEEYDSRTADKFVARLPEGMRERIKARGKADSRSMNSVMLQALTKYLDEPSPVVGVSAEAMETLVDMVMGRINARMVAAEALAVPE